MKKPFSKTTSSSIILSVENIALEIFYTLYRGSRAVRDPGGNFTSPEEEPTLDIEGIYLVDKTADLYDLFFLDVDDLAEMALSELANEDEEEE